MLAKWGVTTPSRGLNDSQQNQSVIFGDLNMQGYPCSTSCRGSQDGRGGSFFSLASAPLHASLTREVISGACTCRPPPSSSALRLAEDPDAVQEFKRLRMCSRGCVHKIDDHFHDAQLPKLSPNASSFWRTPVDGSRTSEVTISAVD